MNKLVNAVTSSTDMTISSLELCKLIKYDNHTYAKKKITKLIETKEFGTASIKIDYVSTGNGGIQNVEAYQLTKEQSLIVAAQLNSLFLIKVINRWQELEQAIREQNILHHLHTDKEFIQQAISNLDGNKKPTDIYLISDGTLVKIGISSDVFNRIKQLQTGNGNSLTILFQQRISRPAMLEMFLHNSFSGNRMNGEWFDLSEEQIKLCKRIINQWGVV